MWDWLLQPIDPDRAHAVGFVVSWHARSMVLAWGVLAPLAVLIARFYKVLPGQDWPRELDSQVWWRIHWIGQSAVLLLTVFGVGLILSSAGETDLHGLLGYLVLGLVAAQVILGLMRGSKGGPTAPKSDGDFAGDHYEMTPWRRMFEAVHKALGYALIALAIVTIVVGLWDANGPHWMWLSLAVWWGVLAIAAIRLQRAGRAVDTYQAIWGPAPDHPGNRLPSPGWGMRRMTEEAGDVRRD